MKYHLTLVAPMKETIVANSGANTGKAFCMEISRSNIVKAFRRSNHLRQSYSRCCWHATNILQAIFNTVTLIFTTTISLSFGYICDRHSSIAETFKSANGKIENHVFPQIIATEQALVAAYYSSSAAKITPFQKMTCSNLQTDLPENENRSQQLGMEIVESQHLLYIGGKKNLFQQRVGCGGMIIDFTFEVTSCYSGITSSLPNILQLCYCADSQGNICKIVHTISWK